MNPRRPLDTLDAAQSAELARRIADQSAPKIIAYHGSPYDFDRFDASKIGTGEGAQAYGHGLYFAGSEGPAEYYRRTLSALARSPEEDALEMWRRHAEKTKSPYQALPDAIEEAQAAMEEAAGIPGAEERWAEILEQLYDIDYRQPLPKRPGHMYEVELGVPEESLLDYDQPFSTPVGAVGAEVLRQGNPVAVSADTLRAIQDGSWAGESFRGRSPYRTAAWELANLARTREGAQALLEAGIPGVRYFDGNSRSAGQGTRNYVMFPGTEDRIRILRKYGLLGPAAVGAGMSQDGQ